MIEYIIHTLLSIPFKVLKQETNYYNKERFYFFLSGHHLSTSTIIDTLFNINNNFLHPSYQHTYSQSFSSTFISHKNITISTSTNFSKPNSPYTTNKIQSSIKVNTCSKKPWFNYFGARYYNSDISVWLSVDPMSDKSPGLSPYHYCSWNPVMLVDPDGMFEESPSTHTDADGNVLAVYNDGDLGVYKHAFCTTKEEVDANHGAILLTNPQSAGGKKMGETEHWDEFMEHDIDGNPTSEMKNAKIYYGTSMDEYVDGLYNMVVDKRANTSYLKTAKWVKQQSDGIGDDGNLFDIKQTIGATSGYLYQNKYCSGRSLGNILAGKNAARLQPIAFSKIQWYILTLELAGGLHMKSNNLKTEPCNGKYYGEIEYAGRMIEKGFWE